MSGQGEGGLNSIACHSFYVIFKIELFPLEKNVYIPKEVKRKMYYLKQIKIELLTIKYQHNSQNILQVLLTLKRTFTKYTIGEKKKTYFKLAKDGQSE